MQAKAASFYSTIHQAHTTDMVFASDYFQCVSDYLPLFAHVHKALLVDKMSKSQPFGFKL